MKSSARPNRNQVAGRLILAQVAGFISNISLIYKMEKSVKTDNIIWTPNNEKQPLNELMRKMRSKPATKDMIKSMMLFGTATKRNFWFCSFSNKR